MLYNDEDEEQKENKFNRSYVGEENSTSAKNGKTGNFNHHSSNSMIVEEEIEGNPPFALIYQPKYTPKPGPLIASLNLANIKAHYKKIPYAILAIYVFLPFYLAIAYMLNNTQR